MKTVVVAAMAALASITGLAGSVHAQSTATPSQETRDFTLSGESLTGIESRTVEGDYQTFFLRGVPGRISVNNREDFSLSRKRSRGLLQVDDDVELLINRSTPQPINASPFRENDRLNDSQRVEVQLGVD